MSFFPLLKKKDSYVFDKIIDWSVDWIDFFHEMSLSVSVFTIVTDSSIYVFIRSKKLTKVFIQTITTHFFYQKIMYWIKKLKMYANKCVFTFVLFKKCSLCDNVLERIKNNASEIKCSKFLSFLKTYDAFFKFHI